MMLCTVAAEEFSGEAKRPKCYLKCLSDLEAASEVGRRMRTEQLLRALVRASFWPCVINLGAETATSSRSDMHILLAEFRLSSDS